MGDKLKKQEPRQYKDLIEDCLLHWYNNNLIWYIYIHPFPNGHNFYRLLSLSLSLSSVVHRLHILIILENGPKLACSLGFIAVAFLIKSSMECTWVYAAAENDRRHFRDKNISGIGVDP